MNTYLLHWRDKTTNEVQGNDIADAFTKAGFGRGALPALDYYEQLREANVKQWSVDPARFSEVKEAVRKVSDVTVYYGERKVSDE
jgi:hypothetical protein